MKRFVTVVSAALVAIALSGCQTPVIPPSPLVIDSAAPASQPGKPRTLKRPGLSGVWWFTSLGEDLGYELDPPKTSRVTSYYEKVNFVFFTRTTSKGHFVGEGKNMWIIWVMRKPGDSQRMEIYGPDLKSIRSWREGELSMLNKGSDIWYITPQGTFKASELGN